MHPHLFSRFEMIDSARNKLRVKAAYVMMAATIAACGVMVFMGKQVSHRFKQLSMYRYMNFSITAGILWSSVFVTVLPI